MDPHPAYDGDPSALARWRGDAAEPPSHAVWEITLRCDLGCRHCGSRAARPRANELTTAEALDVVAQLADLGLKEVSLIGGEFYLREDWDQIALAISKRGMVCSLVTGARQMTAARVERAVGAGVARISLSIDGLERTHDALRGSKGSWRAAVAAARLIAEAGIDLSVNTQINRMTLPELPGVADLLVDLGARAWMAILTAAMGRGADHPALLLQPYHLLTLFPLLAAIKRETLEPAGIGFFPANNLGYFGPLAEALRYGGDRGHAWSGCGAGVSSLGIEADGRLKGCPSLPSADYAVGSLREDRLADLWARAKPVAKAEDLWGFCGACEHRARCKAGCTWTAHTLFGRPGNNPYCHHRATTLASQGLAETLELEAPAPGHPFDFGHWRLVERTLDDVREGDAVLDRTLASHAFGFRSGATGVWTAQELEALLSPPPTAARLF